MNYYAARLKGSPASLPQLLVALDFAQSKPKQIVLAGHFCQSRKLVHKRTSLHFTPKPVPLHPVLTFIRHNEAAVCPKTVFLKSVS